MVVEVLSRPSFFYAHSHACLIVPLGGVVRRASAVCRDVDFDNRTVHCPVNRFAAVTLARSANKGHGIYAFFSVPRWRFLKLRFCVRGERLSR